MPQDGILLPIPRAAPVAAGAASVSRALTTRPHPYQAVPPTPIERGISDSGKRRLVRTFTTLFILIICVLVGSGIYFFFHQTGTQPPPESTIDTTISSIQGVPIASTTEAGATITWETDEPATSQVQYGKTEQYGSTTTENTNLSTSHTVKLTGLDDDTTYYFKVISKDASGNKATLAGDQPFTTESVIPVGYEVDDLAYQFALQDINETEWKLRDFRGKIVMVNFWATWCPPCVGEMLHFQEIAQDWSGDLQIFAITSINAKQSKRDVSSFLQANPGYTFTVLLDPDGEVSTLYGITPTTYIPRTFFIDADGIIRKVQEDSFKSPTEIANILNSLK